MPETKMRLILLEVGVDLIMPGVGGIIRRHRKIGECHAWAGGIDLQALIASRLTVGIIQEPVATDLTTLFEAVEGNTCKVKRFGGRKSRLQSRTFWAKIHRTRWVP